MSVRITGLKGAQNALDKMAKQIEDGSEEMLTVMLMAVSAQTMPFVPVDTSALINSERRRVWTSDGYVRGEIEYGGQGRNARGTPIQEYAGIVHDGPQKNWQKPGASNKFLAKGVRRFLREDFDDIVKGYSRTS